MLKRNLLTLVLIFCLANVCIAADGNDAASLAKAAQNPLATMVTLPLQANYNTGYGDFDRTFYSLNVQPVIPFPGESLNIIVRTILPVNSVPLGEFDSSFGIGDAQLSAYFSPNSSGSVTWGVGPIFGLPSASNPELMGSGKWGVGPAGILFIMTGKWTMGALASNTWSFAGDKDRENYNKFLGQYFINYNFGGGWAVGTAPIVTANWDAESGEQWTVPFGLQISKVTHFGSRPVNLLVGYYHNSEHATGGAQNQTRVQINFMFPTGLK